MLLNLGLYYIWGRLLHLGLLQRDTAIQKLQNLLRNTCTSGRCRAILKFPCKFSSFK